MSRLLLQRALEELEHYNTLCKHMSIHKHGLPILSLEPGFLLQRALEEPGTVPAVGVQVAEQLVAGASMKEPRVREMGGAPGNPAPRNHFSVRLVKPSGCHCTDGHFTSRVFTEDQQIS